MGCHWLRCGCAHGERCRHLGHLHVRHPASFDLGRPASASHLCAIPEKQDAPRGPAHRADESEIDDTSESSLLREAFSLFDLDNSGDIDTKEVRSMLTTMYPLMPIHHRKVALKLQSGIDGDARLRFEDFDDTILEWRRYAEANDPDNTWRKPRLGISDHSRRLSEKMASMGRMASMGVVLPSVKFEFSKAEVSERGASSAHELPEAGV